MHDIEPYYNWRDYYRAEDDSQSPFFEKEYSEFYYTNRMYDHLIHPQWDEFGSSTLYMKILFADYEEGFCIIELLGEWNDAINNDIMFLKRDIAEVMMNSGIDKFILIGENVLNFHASDDSYYEEWFDDLEEGWVALLNFREHVLDEFRHERIDYYLNFGGELDDCAWRMLTPVQLYNRVSGVLARRIGV